MPAKYAAFNRTKQELKHADWDIEELEDWAFNRTKQELKHFERDSNDITGYLLIAPSRN